MIPHRHEGNDAGFTLVELMFTAGIMSVGLVMLMGTVINVSSQSQVSEIAVMASHFNSSVLESMRGRDERGLLTFNDDESEFDVQENGKTWVEHMGHVTVDMWCLMPDGNGGTQRTEIPMTEEAISAMTAPMPNPVEVQVQVSLDKSRGTGNEFKFMSSALIYH